MMQSENILVQYMARRAVYDVPGTLGTNWVILRHKFGVPRKNYVFKLCTTSKIPVRWPGQCYGFTLSLIFKYCGGIGLY